MEEIIYVICRLVNEGKEQEANKELRAYGMYCESSLRVELDAAKAEVIKWQRIRKPDHGPCCTCQKCGLDYDSCRCDLDEVADELEQVKAELKEARNAALDEAAKACHNLITPAIEENNSEWVCGVKEGIRMCAERVQLLKRGEE